MSDSFKHIKDLTPSRFERNRRVSAGDASVQPTRRGAAQRDRESVFPPTPPSRLRSLLLPAEQQIAATQYFVAWITTVPPLITTRKEGILPEFVCRCESLLSQADTPIADDCHPLHEGRRSYTISFVVNIVLRAADDAISAELQTPGSINELLLPFLKKWSRPSTSGPIATMEAVRKRRHHNAELFQFTGACAKLIGSRAHAIPLFNDGQYGMKDEEYVEKMAAAEPATVDCSIYHELDPSMLMPRLVPAMKRLPMYGLLELYPFSIALKSQLPTQRETQEERLYKEHNDARTEVVASKNPRYNKPDENLYPACHIFMRRVIEHLKLTTVQSEGTFSLSSDDLENPASKQYLLRLRNKDENDCIESESQVAFSLAVPYFIGTIQIQLLYQGQDWRLNWPSNKVLVFLEKFRLLGDGHVQIHVQSFKKVISNNT